MEKFHVTCSGCLGVTYLIHKHPVTVLGGQICFHCLQRHREKQRDRDGVNNRDCLRPISSHAASQSLTQHFITLQVQQPDLPVWPRRTSCCTTATAALSAFVLACVNVVCRFEKFKSASSSAAAVSVTACPAKMSSNKGFCESEWFALIKAPRARLVLCHRVIILITRSILQMIAKHAADSTKWSRA